MKMSISETQQFVFLFVCFSSFGLFSVCKAILQTSSIEDRDFNFLIITFYFPEKKFKYKAQHLYV